MIINKSKKKKGGVGLQQCKLNCTELAFNRILSISAGAITEVNRNNFLQELASSGICRGAAAGAEAEAGPRAVGSWTRLGFRRRKRERREILLKTHEKEPIEHICWTNDYLYGDRVNTGDTISLGVLDPGQARMP